jgi:signal transduction histidine kinase
VRPAQKLARGARKQAWSEVLIWVKDTGIGIRPQKLKYVFGKFTQVYPEASPEKRGTGLGFFIC